MINLTDNLIPEPKPCPVCACAHPHTVYVGGGVEALLPFWVRIQCRRCGRSTKRKLFRSRAVRAWNRDAIK